MCTVPVLSVEVPTSSDTPTGGTTVIAVPGSGPPVTVHSLASCPSSRATSAVLASAAVESKSMLAGRSSASSWKEPLVGAVPLMLTS
jgi:hypothetical protein